MLELLVHPAYADTCPAADSFRDIRSIDTMLKTETSQRTIFDSLKTCNWSITEMIRKTYEEVKQTASSVLSGAIFKDLLSIIMGFESALNQFRDNIMPMLSMMREKMGEMFDHLVCDFSQKNIRSMVMGVVLPGGGTAGPWPRLPSV